MKQISRRTNPTDLKQLDRKHFTLRVADEVGVGRSFWIERFDHKAAGVPAMARMSCIAGAGSTEQYFELGDASAFQRKPMFINELARDKPLRFRFVFNLPGDVRLLGYVDGVQPVDEAGNLGGSLVDIHPMDLDGPLWLLALPSADDPDDKPCLMVERSIFPTAQSAVAHPWFVALVMPEVMRQIAVAISENGGALEDDGSWMGKWKEYFNALGVSEVPDEDALGDWAVSVAKRFAGSGPLRLQFERLAAEMQGELE
ncbi:hypothetical protein VA603_19170 [Stenotrophomonas sp. MH1]|uniref:Uncharacterized protein n=1 Tax=Stenotrophomonas capsici TaxID=3110230 RepID=A0ABU5V8H6_9GAMM|nr:hypothetical protein [Stenotrophomonas sp. MH1]MEA5669658.1 hypothetical protein [Stenotrophomonas sp. MH1]